MQIDCFAVSSAAQEITVEIGRIVGRLLKPGNVVLLCGDLGAGKTQLTKGVAEVFADAAAARSVFVPAPDHIACKGIRHA